VTAGWRHAAAWILGAFLLGLVTVALALAWLLSPSRALRDGVVVLFAVELVSTALAAIVTARAVLWR
jgi:hypothetical protein